MRVLHVPDEVPVDDPVLVARIRSRYGPASRRDHDDADDTRTKTMHSAPAPRLSSSPIDPASPPGSDAASGGLRRTYRISNVAFKEASAKASRSSSRDKDKDRDRDRDRDRKAPTRTASADTGVALRNARRLDSRNATLDKTLREGSSHGNGTGSSSAAGYASASSRSRRGDDKRTRNEDKASRSDERRGRTEEKDRTQDKRDRSEQRKGRLEDRKVKVEESRRPGQRISSSNGRYANGEKNRAIN